MTVGTSFQNGSFMGGSATAGTFTLNGGVTTSSLYNTDALDRRYEYTDTKEGYEIAYSGRDAAINSCIANVKSYIAQGREDKALEAYQELLTQMKSQTRYAQLVDETGDDSQLRAIARELINANMDDNQTLEEFIKTNTANKFERGFEINWDGDKATEEDLLNEMCNLDETGRFDTLEYLGGKACKMALTTGGGAAIGAAIGAIGGPIGAGIGAVVGAVVGLII